MRALTVVPESTRGDTSLHPPTAASPSFESIAETAAVYAEATEGPPTPTSTPVLPRPQDDLTHLRKTEHTL